MKKPIAAFALALALAGGALLAQTLPLTQTLNLTAFVSSRYKLEMSAGSVTFTRVANPQTRPDIPQNESPISVTVKATTSRFLIFPQTINLRIEAVGTLTDPSSGTTIPVSAVTWKASGVGFVGSGTLSSGTAALLGTWNASGVYDGTITFSFRDDPNYPPGTYRLTVTLTVGAS